ncbi:MAG: hypothetical protein NDI75_11705 [Candidatus Didemnitutus sp.]|nr:hypothetical protein [Candidatus Didemnitutus sp.]
MNSDLNPLAPAASVPVASPQPFLDSASANASVPVAPSKPVQPAPRVGKKHRSATPAVTPNRPAR